MKFFVWISFIACLFAYDATGQTIKKYKINPGQKVSEVIPQNEVYSNKEKDLRQLIVFLKKINPTMPL